jgi:glycosyltransferase involved in cell wall biosynthesis
MPGAKACRPPSVSVCIPAYNSERWTSKTMRSVLEQTYEDFELIVVDDASDDDTLREVRAFDDPRIRVYANSTNLGHTGNWNKTLNLARGSFVKFLSCDDILYADCLETMVDLLVSHPTVGLVFSRRDIELTDPADPQSVRLKAKHDRGHTHLGELGDVNDGRSIFARWIGEGLSGNWVGEPTSVMMRRDCLREIGTFAFHIHQRSDMDLWLRAMYFFDVGFVDRPLAKYVVRSGSLTGVNRATDAGWLDNLWLLDGLLSYEEIRQGSSDVRALRRATIARVSRHALRCIATGKWEPLAAGRDYLVLRLRGGLDRSRLYGELREEPLR